MPKGRWPRAGRRIATRWRHLPSGALALRAGLAAVLAWLAALALGGVADDYPYYAPLGAVVAVSASVTASIAVAVRTVAAISIGAALGLALGSVPAPTPVGIGLVVVVGTVVGTWRRLGDSGSWVAISALFILVLGARDPWHFGLGYVALIALGAGVGAAVNLALPPLRLKETSRAQDALRTALVEQLERLARALEADQPPTPAEWRGERIDTETRAQEVRALVTEALERARVNWREQLRRQRAADLSARGEALATLALHVGDLTDFLTEREHAHQEVVPLGPDLRPWAVSALRDTARALGDVDAAAVAAARESVAQLAEAIRASRQRTGHDLFAAGALVVALQRQLDVVEARVAGRQVPDGAPASAPEE